MWSLGRTPVGKYGLMVWMLLIHSAPVVCDEHVGGDLPHAHGLGLFALSAATSARNTPADTAAPRSRHFHLIILGVEFYLPGQAGGSTQPSPDAAGGNCTLTSELAGGPYTCAHAPAPAPVTDNTAFANGPVTAPPAGPCATPSPQLPLPFDLLCDLARARRSGVQRI
jgi:hypothetical protein